MLHEHSVAFMMQLGILSHSSIFDNNTGGEGYIYIYIYIYISLYIYIYRERERERERGRKRERERERERERNFVIAITARQEAEKKNWTERRPACCRTQRC